MRVVHLLDHGDAATEDRHAVALVQSSLLSPSGVIPFAPLDQVVQSCGIVSRIVPKRYGGGTTKDDFGYTGLGVVNDGKQSAYDIAIHSIELKDGTKLVFHRGHTERLTDTDGEAFYPAFLEARLSGTFGSGLFDFMRERGIPSITVPITYRDSNNNWFQTDVTFERDVQKSGGLRLGWTQKPIPAPDTNG